MTDQARWDQRYADALAPNPPARVLTDNLHLLPAEGDALELACGLGGNALALAGAGLRTQAWDLSPVALAKLTSFVTLIIFTLMNVALWRIKRRGDPEYQGFQVPLWVPAAGATVSLLLLASQVYEFIMG